MSLLFLTRPPTEALTHWLTRTLLWETLEDAPLGQQRYAQVCSGCHGLQGGGDIGPPLAGNPALQNEQLVLTTILYGRGQMPAFSLYSDLEIAEIASYIRTEWSNGYSPIAAEQVQAYRPDPQTAETGGE